MSGRRALGPAVNRLAWHGGTTLRDSPLIPSTERKQTDLEKTFEWQMSASPTVNAFGWLVEYEFHPTRKWRFDFAFLRLKIAVEIEGGTWVGGRHLQPQAFEDDCEKYAEAAIGGWRLLRVTGHMVEDGRGLILLERLLATVTS